MSKIPVIFEGDLYLAFLDGDGNSLGEEMFGNTIEMTLTNESDKKAIRSRGRDTGGQTIGGVTRLQGTTVSLKGNTFDEKILAMWNMGEAVAMAGAGGSVVDESATARHDKWVDLAYRDVSSVVVTDSTGTTTYVEGTDYTVNTRLGKIQALSTGSITDEESLLVDYDWAAETGHKIVGATKQVHRVRLFLDGKNLENEKDCYVTVFDSRLSSNTPFDAMKEEHQEYGFSGDCITPDGQSGPYQIEYKS